MNSSITHQDGAAAVYLARGIPSAGNTLSAKLEVHKSGFFWAHFS